MKKSIYDYLSTIKVDQKKIDEFYYELAVIIQEGARSKMGDMLILATDFPDFMSKRERESYDMAKAIRKAAMDFINDYMFKNQ